MRALRGKTVVTAGMTLGLVVSILGPSPAGGSQSTVLDLALCAPGQNSFTLRIDNSYLPLSVGRQWVFQGDEGGQTLGLQITVLNKKETFFFTGAEKVTTRVVEEREWVDANGNGLFDDGTLNLIEVALNYFAQTQDGTVCYFGEDVDFYEGGAIVDHAGSWRADDLGNAPGIFMPAAPQAGMRFQQEMAPGIAEDEATIVGSGPADVPAGTLKRTIRLREFNPIDGGTGYKVYARNVGLIKDGAFELISY